MTETTAIQANVATLTDMLRQVALDVVAAQAALDAEAERRASDAFEDGSTLPVLSFYFPEIELDLQLAFSVTQFQGSIRLGVTPANPTSNAFYQSASFSSRLRAKIAPRAALVPLSTEQLPSPDS